MHGADTHQAIETVWRLESPRLIAALIRVVRDIDLAEELAQDALVAALEHWPREGVPDNPGAWLMTAAKRRGIDQLRRRRLIERKHAELGDDPEHAAFSMPDLEALDDDIGDDLLRLIFTACHPALSVDAQIALTLRLLAGLSTEEIARAYLAAEPTIAQRIVRAKRTLAKANVVYEVPRGEALAERLGAVLGTIYLIFNEGYTATSGSDWMRPALCEEALRLGRMLAALMPRNAEVHGLLALLEIQASRSHARVSADGQPILLPEQDRSRWDRLQIQRGLAALERAEKLDAARGPYTLQAAIAACHARAASAEQTDWPRIASLYAELARVTPSPVVELNRAVAISRADGPAAGLRLIDSLRDEPALANYHLLPAVRGDLLEKLGRHNEARVEFKRAASLTRNARERDVMLARAGKQEPAPPS
ncbi:RNA polymerase sigma factor [Rhodanobacter sp. 115]|uniref:RNA polymerase sigma factor n=1 Tax=Rhodanobacter sp. FW021-MT20 TaxID=1162282 RepID=UPI00056859F5|nr:RNA polymerase sigma factor [Rhodanobacter sp. 115]